MERIRSHEDLEEAVGQLVKIEPRFSAVLDRHGLPPLRHMQPGLETLLRIVTDQLISLKAGEAIWKRLKTRFGTFEPDDLVACGEKGLRTLGLSGAKARTFLALARAASEDGLPDPSAKPMSDECVIRSLVAIPGVGPWTAQIYLLSALHAADAWPAADVALQAAAHDLFTLPARPSTREMDVISVCWRPYRAAAARLLWSHYRGLKQLPQVPI